MFNIVKKFIAKATETTAQLLKDSKSKPTEKQTKQATTKPQQKRQTTFIKKNLKEPRPEVVVTEPKIKQLKRQIAAASQINIE